MNYIVIGSEKHGKCLQICFLDGEDKKITDSLLEASVLAKTMNESIWAHNTKYAVYKIEEVV